MTCIQDFFKKSLQCNALKNFEKIQGWKICYKNFGHPPCFAFMKQWAFAATLYISLPYLLVQVNSTKPQKC